MNSPALDIPLKRYPEYKDSGEEWLGEIPSDWELQRIKYLFREVNDRSTTGDEDLLSVSQYTGVTKRSNSFAEGEDITTAATLEGYKRVKQGDLVSNIMLAWNGSLGFSALNGITSPAYGVYRSSGKTNARFLHYLFRTDRYKGEWKRNSSGIMDSRLRLYTEDFFSIWCLLPPDPQQTAIADFLDDKTAKIDEAIAQKERMIKLLQERKQILIQTAVTKGLDPNVRMKDSGIDWIGEIPAHWEVCAIRRKFRVLDCKHKTVEFFEEGYPLASIREVHGLEVDLRQANRTNLDGYNEMIDGDRRPRPGDIIYSRNASVGDAALVTSDEEFSMGQDVCLLRGSELDPAFAVQAIRSDYVRNQAEILMVGATIRRINVGQLKGFFLAVPPPAEQEVILLSIQKNTEKFDQGIASQWKEISRLRELRATIVDSAVTGKIKVTP